MSTCIEDSCDYDLGKNCSKCGIISLKSNFHKNKLTKDGFCNRCRLCRKQYYKES